MGVDFGDMNDDGLLDIYVSNIAADYALHESHFAWINTGETARMNEGIAPFVDQGEALGLSRSSWSWESRLADLNNDGMLEALQATGFKKGSVNRWGELQELGLGNDNLTHFPAAWPIFDLEADLNGDAPNGFFVRGASGRYVDLAANIGIAEPQVTRGIATADVDGDGALDFAVANQWAASRFYHNDCPACGNFLGLHLLLPIAENSPSLIRNGPPSADTVGRPAIGAFARVHLADGQTLVGMVDGGNGQAGERSSDSDIHRNLSEIDFQRTLAPKVTGLRHLLAALDPAKLRLIVGFLSQAQQAWGQRFANPKIADRFAGIPYSEAITGSPILPGSLAWVDCTLHQAHDAGDHTIFVGKVVAGDVVPGEQLTVMPPLLYYNRGWRTLALSGS
jgi:hypothetical protein